MKYNEIVNDICHKLREVKTLPRRDGTGPLGVGAKTGRGFGLCTGIKAAKYGIGLGMGLGLARRGGFGGKRFFFEDNESSLSQKEFLEEEKSLLQNRLDLIEGQLKDL